jgi:predicted DNA-binding transcriptional regulator YafY
LKVYQGLGQFIRLPARTPQALLDYLASLADPDALASAEATAAMTLEALQEVVAGRAVFPPLVEPLAEGGLPVEESLAVIKQALAEGMALEMDYYTAGRDELTHRQVEPYRLEWRGASRGAARPGRAREEQPALGSPGGGRGARGKGVPYLVGFCHRAQAERVFRVDRIHSIVKAPPAESERGLDGL